MDLDALLSLAGAHGPARLVHVGVQTGLFDALARAEQATAEALASALGLHAPTLALFLDALAALQLVDKHTGMTPEVYALAPAARRWLDSASPECISGMVRFESLQWDNWGRLADALRTGQPVRSADMYQEDPRETRVFIEAMHALVVARGDAAHLAGHPRIAAARRILDVGGGPGTYAMTFLNAHAEAHATIFDLPGTLAVTGALVEEHAPPAVRARLTLTVGDYHRDPLPGAFDLVFLSNMIHGEPLDGVRRLLRACYWATSPGGFVAIKDHILDEGGTSPPKAALFTPLMILTTGGRDYRFSEVARALDEAGFDTAECEELPARFGSRLVWARRPAEGQQTSGDRSAPTV